MTRPWSEVKLTKEDVRKYCTGHEKLLDVTDERVRFHRWVKGAM